VACNNPATSQAQTSGVDATLMLQDEFERRRLLQNCVELLSCSGEVSDRRVQGFFSAIKIDVLQSDNLTIVVKNITLELVNPINEYDSNDVECTFWFDEYASETIIFREKPIKISLSPDEFEVFARCVFFNFKQLYSKDVIVVYKSGEYIQNSPPDTLLELEVKFDDVLYSGAYAESEESCFFISPDESFRRILLKASVMEFFGKPRLLAGLVRTSHFPDVYDDENKAINEQLGFVIFYRGELVLFPYYIL
jgi:hypothetical protein